MIKYAGRQVNTLSIEKLNTDVNVDKPVFFCSFLSSLPDLEVILLICLPEGAADVGLPSLGGTAEVRGSFSVADGLFGSFAGCPVPVRTQRAFFRARSSSSKSSFSPGDISVFNGSSIQEHWAQTNCFSVQPLLYKGSQRVFQNVKGKKMTNAH